MTFPVQFMNLMGKCQRRNLFKIFLPIQNPLGGKGPPERLWVEILLSYCSSAMECITTVKGKL